MKRNRYIALLLTLVFTFSVATNLAAGILCSATMRPVKIGHACCCESMDPPSSDATAGGVRIEESRCNGTLKSNTLTMAVFSKPADDNPLYESSGLPGGYARTSYESASRIEFFDYSEFESPPVFISTHSFLC